MQVSATAKRLRISPRKLRLVADQVRGKAVEEALNILGYSTKKGAPLIRKVLNSAIANAENNEGADVDELAITSIHVDGGVTVKRMRPRARGRFGSYSKRATMALMPSLLRRKSMRR